MGNKKRKQKKPLFEFEVQGVYKVSFDTTIKAKDAESAEEAARDEFEKELGRTSGCFYTDEIDIDSIECVMERLCAICGKLEEKMPKAVQKSLRDFTTLGYEDTVEYGFPYLNGEIICPEHRKKPGKFKKAIRILEKAGAWKFQLDLP